MAHESPHPLEVRGDRPHHTRALLPATAVALLASLAVVALAIVTMPGLEADYNALGETPSQSASSLFNLVHSWPHLISLIAVATGFFIALFLLARRYWAGLVLLAPVVYFAGLVTVRLVIWLSVPGLESM